MSLRCRKLQETSVEPLALGAGAEIEGANHLEGPYRDRPCYSVGGFWLPPRAIQLALEKNDSLPDLNCRSALIRPLHERVARILPLPDFDELSRVVLRERAGVRGRTPRLANRAIFATRCPLTLPSPLSTGERVLN